MNDKSSVQIVGTVAGSATDPLVLITPRGIHCPSEPRALALKGLISMLEPEVMDGD
jgi:hypothetical protein